MKHTHLQKTYIGISLAAFIVMGGTLAYLHPVNLTGQTTDDAISVCGDGICSYNEWGTCEKDNCLATRCTDSDPKDDVHTKGVVRANGKNRKSDYCDNNTLHQYQCIKASRVKAEYKYSTVQFNCTTGCENGVCLGTESGALTASAATIVSRRDIRLGIATQDSGRTSRESDYDAARTSIPAQTEHTRRQRAIEILVTGSASNVLEARNAVRDKRRAERTLAKECKVKNRIWAACRRYTQAVRADRTETAIKNYKKIACFQGKRNISYKRELARLHIDCSDVLRDREAEIAAKKVAEEKAAAEAAAKAAEIAAAEAEKAALLGPGAPVACNNIDNVTFSESLRAGQYITFGWKSLPFSGGYGRFQDNKWLDWADMSLGTDNKKLEPMVIQIPDYNAESYDWPKGVLTITCEDGQVLKAHMPAMKDPFGKDGLLLEDGTYVHGGLYMSKNGSTYKDSSYRDIAGRAEEN